MNDKTEIPGITDKNLPDLVAGARVVSASPLDNLIDEIFGGPPASVNPVDIKPKN